MQQEGLVQNQDYFKLRDKVEWEMGIDEAGRGPVFGSMIYAACELSKIGFDDSKKLKPDDREYLFQKIKEMNQIKLSYKVDELTAKFLSNSSLGIFETNLNQVSHNSALKLIEDIIKEGYNLKMVYLDTVGPKETYQRWLYSQFQHSNPQINFTVSEKADSKYPVVSAASICAKVTRDEILQNWKFEETKPFARNFGSGYPSDPVTQKWLDENFTKVFGYPTIVRFSWKTTQAAMEKKQLSFEYHQENDQIQNQIQNQQNLKIKRFYKIQYSNFKF